MVVGFHTFAWTGVTLKDSIYGRVTKTMEVHG
jgi:hypothetical protein